MLDRKYRVLAVATHPVQYMTPIFRRMAKHPSLDFHVAYCSLRGAEAGHDPEFGAQIQWDVPVLDGHSWTHVPNRGSGAESFFGLFNPGLWRLIRRENYDAVLCFIGYVRATFWITCLATKFSKAAFLFGADATSLTPRDGRNWKIPIKRFFWPRLFRLADQVIVPSSDGRDFMCSLGIPREHVSLTGDCVDNDWWMQQSKVVDRAAVRASWGVSPDDAVIVFSAKLQQWPSSSPAQVRSREPWHGLPRPFSGLRQPIATPRRLYFGRSLYPLRNFLGAFGYERWPYAYGIGTTSLGTQYVARIFHAKPPVVGVESGFGTLVVEMGIGGLVLWFVMTFAILYSAWQVVKKLRGSPWFPLAFAIFWYAGLLLLPMTFSGIQPYEDFVLNAYFWLLLGILFRLPTLAVSAQYAATAQPSPMYDPRIRMR